MSGDSSTRNFSTIASRARIELMFQDTILRDEDMGWDLAMGVGSVDDLPRASDRCARDLVHARAALPPNGRPPLRGRGARATKRCYARSITRLARATGGKLEPGPAIAWCF